MDIMSTIKPGDYLRSNYPEVPMLTLPLCQMDELRLVPTANTDGYVGRTPMDPLIISDVHGDAIEWAARYRRAQE